MKTFTYRVRDRRGKAVTGTMQGESAQAVTDALGKQGYFPMSISESKSMDFSFMDVFKPRVKRQDLNVFTRQLWTLQKTGLPLLAGLSSLREQATSETFKKIIVQIIKDLESGSSLSTALAKQPRTFEPVYIHMVRAGEASGKLDEIFYELSEMGEFDARTRSKIHSATIYPMITLFSLSVAFLVVTTNVVPKFTGVFAQRGRQLPTPTRILLMVNDILRHHTIEVVIGLALFIFLFRLYISKPAGRYQFDYLTLRVPVIGKLILYLQMSRFGKILSELLKTGVPILQSLQLVSDTLNNKVIDRAVQAIQRSVNEGKGMSTAMKGTRIFSPMVIQMVEVGEQSGRTDELLAYVAEYYEDQANQIIKNFSTLIEPILLLILGSMVLLLALGVFMPVWDLINVVR